MATINTLTTSLSGDLINSSCPDGYPSKWAQECVLRGELNSILLFTSVNHRGQLTLKNNAHFIASTRNIMAAIEKESFSYLNLRGRTLIGGCTPLPVQGIIVSEFQIVSAPLCH